MKIKKNKKFNKAVQKMVKGGNFPVGKFKEVVQSLELEEPLPSYCKSHKIKEKSHNGLSVIDVHIKDDVVLFYSVDNKKRLIYLIDIGTHSDMF
ncbi:type II toxin-antitoxin system mRNA interferase toxin, RelE/StbE family [Enterococcus durans]|uniref:type II toxin-antitoxin system mRNA interferase toxin, RelE/StbE family n=1 Tax=Enterococcus durans TaxID=53345 RepID=UPI001C011C74|nr:type II toxin-antitoxin system mRNA interferase toxin, RelE/StbE family [Enterococcus durans]MBT9718239.1 type II toxin-antitoxin system mRNA interferase toxin, RelE/StbE family [Enterococcus durans]